MAGLTALPIAVTHGWADYALLDSGGGRKYERYGPHRFIRPEPQALWPQRLPDWPADGEFIGGSDEDGGGRWQLKPGLPDYWPLSWGDVRFHASCTPFRHLAFFPDQAVHWAWMQDRLAPGDAVLNLFGYTGVASLVAAARGAVVTHVDASRKSVSAAAENQQLSSLGGASVRWIVDDALKFMRREVRRERRYQLILLDPPKFGRGPDGERWDLFEGLPELLACARQLVDPARGAVILTAYAIRASALALDGAMRVLFTGGTLESGEMAIAHEGDARLLPTAMFSRWTA
jgi:23S rRNA (cytosine1962-C5)-methyltransferase